MAYRKLVFILLIAATSSMGWAANSASSTRTTLTGREVQLWSNSVHKSDFSTVAQSAIRENCESMRDPVALATPEPMLDTPVSDTKVTVTFIVGTDGRVHSPLVLESRGPSDDREVLDAVRVWRYRPATCNGVPTEMEGKIAFSGR